MLQRFYGGSPQDWLDLPQPMLGAYVQMLPRIKAQEALELFSVLAMAQSPPTAPQTRQEATARRRAGQQVQAAIKRLEFAANGNRTPSRGQQRKQPVSMARLAEIGFDVVSEKQPETESS